MIGVFDSGAGGIAVTRELRSLYPMADIVFFRDRLGAPYGTKSKEELKRLVAHDIRTLLGIGASEILMACCTASTVHSELDEELQGVSIPIIEPTARAAVSVTKQGKIGVIATNMTASSHAFKNAIHSIDGNIRVSEWKTQPLVALVEGGARDENLTKREIQIIKATLRDVIPSDIDTLILGCTHFPLIEKTISSLLPWVKTVSSAKEGARALKICDTGQGKSIYLENKRR